MNKSKIGLIAASVSVCIFAAAASEDGISVGTCMVTEGQETVSRKYAGRVIPIEKVAVIAQVSGEITEVGFKEGERVSKGQLLYKLDDVKYSAAEKAASAAVAQCGAASTYAKKTLDRTETLFNRGVATSNELDAAVSASDSAAAALRSASANLLLAEDNLKHTKIVSPIDGIIGANAFTVGNYVTPASGALAEIVSDDPVRVRLSISNRDLEDMFGSIEGLKSEAELTVLTATGSVYPVEGTVEFVDNIANAETDCITVFAKFGNAEGILFPGTAVTVGLTRKDPRVQIAVDATAIVFMQGKTFVFVVKDGNIAERREVVIGGENEGKRFIKSGLSIGDKVVSLGTHKVYDGAKLNVAFEAE